jgi:hypothetical protein
MATFKQAFAYPFQNPKSLLIASALKIVPFLNLISAGFQFQAVKSAMKKEYNLPEVRNLAYLFKIGLLGRIIFYLFLTPFLLLTYYSFKSLTNIAITPTATFNPNIFSNFILFMIIIGIFALFLVPAPVIQFLETDKFSYAFNLKVLARNLFSLSYLKAWLMSIPVFLFYFLLFLAVILLVIPLLGTNPFISLIGLFIEYLIILTGAISVWSILGEGFYEKTYSYWAYHRQRQY